mmetsp:Transcript_6665/g.15119  ORF Transcript_6665/g.15119 Transcript_6665/m.15119 type:complete len:244 (+) Transcript_6665:142-873(+)
MIGGTSTTAGENSNDECCICGDDWSEGQHGWVLCDSHGCENTVCPKCTSNLSLSVSELFYCPICAGSGQSAAATAGGAVATAVAACTELEKLPLSFKTTQKILSNLFNEPEELKYRKLRLENKSVKQLVDLEPVLNILTSVGFARTQCARQNKSDAKSINADLLPTEEVLLLEGPVPSAQINELLQIMKGLTAEANENDIECDGKKNGEDFDSSSSTEVKEKRKPPDDAASDKLESNKKTKGR